MEPQAIRKTGRRHSSLRRLCLVTGLCGLALPATLAFADDAPYSAGNFGGIGLLEMRTARFLPDGTILVGAHRTDQLTRYFSSWQATPWLETTLAYSDDRGSGLGVDRSLDIKIRLMQEGDFRPNLAVGIQDALGTGLYAGEYIVASKRYYDFDFTAGLAWGYLGSRGGPGNIFKLFGDGFDSRATSAPSGGIRRGSYFAGDEMALFAGVEYFSPVPGLSFKVEYSGVDATRIPEFSHIERKSAFNFGATYRLAPWVDVAVGFDHGERVTLRLTLKQNVRTLKLGRLFATPKPAPIFERAEKDIPQEKWPEVAGALSATDLLFDRLRRLGVTIKAMEQKADTTVVRVAAEESRTADPLVILGAVLESYDRATLYIDGADGNVSRYDATKTGTIGRAARDKFLGSVVHQRELAAEVQVPEPTLTTAQTVHVRMARQKLSPLSVTVDRQQALVRKNVGPFPSEVQNIGRTARLLTQEMPDDVEEFIIASEQEGLEVSRVSLLRRDLEKANRYEGSPEEIQANSVIAVPGEGMMDKDMDTTAVSHAPSPYPALSWGIKPELRTHFGGNEDGRFRADAHINIFGSLQIMRRVMMSAEFSQYIAGDIDGIPPRPASHIPAVRSDIARYAREGRSALGRLQLDYTTEIAEGLYGRLSGGFLERMYGGVGAEILYRPYGHNLAVGFDVNWVKQRDFDQLFSFRDYSTVTGHVTLYHENRDYDITSKLSAGRYLAGDYGVTLDISRRFANGVRIGAWATYTDMSSQEFGDGSFDKGLYLAIPLDIFWPTPSREKTRFDFRSLGKDGGQRLAHRTRLYDILSPGQRYRLRSDWQRILD